MAKAPHPGVVAPSTVDGLPALSRRVDGPLHRGEDVARVLVEDAPLREQHHASRCALEERRAQLGLQRANLSTDGRLRHEETFGRAPHVPCLGHGDEVTKLREAHARHGAAPAPRPTSHRSARERNGIGRARRPTHAWRTRFVAGEWDNESNENVIEGVTLTCDSFALVQWVPQLLF